MCSQVLAAFKADVAITEEATDLSALAADRFGASAKYRQWLAAMNAALVFDFIHTRAEVLYPDGINVQPGSETRIRISLKNQLPDPRHIDVTYYLPDGFILQKGPRHVNLPHKNSINQGSCELDITIQAGDRVDAVNRGIIQMVAAGRPTVMLIPLLFFGV
jgi:hypothetical protein